VEECHCPKCRLSLLRNKYPYCHPRCSLKLSSFALQHVSACDCPVLLGGEIKKFSHFMCLRSSLMSSTSSLCRVVTSVGLSASKGPRLTAFVV
jgi:hypothetical protein